MMRVRTGLPELEDVTVIRRFQVRKRLFLCGKAANNKTVFVHTRCVNKERRRIETGIYYHKPLASKVIDVRKNYFCLYMIY